MFADKDDEDCNQNAENTLKTVTLREGETVFACNKRFGHLHRNCQSCGARSDDTEKARICLRGLKKHPNSAVPFEVEAKIRMLDAPDFEGLTEIQQKELNFFENLKRSFQDFELATIFDFLKRAAKDKQLLETLIPLTDTEEF